VYLCVLYALCGKFKIVRVVDLTVPCLTLSMTYFVRTPWLLRTFYPAFEWEIPTKEKIIYLTFDDGPHPVATPFVLDLLKRHEAFATFFCIGKNVVQNPEIYLRILDEGHSVGNHTYHHFNGWKTTDEIYLKDIAEAAKYIDSALFRPPYGRIKKFQARHLINSMKVAHPRIIMWSVLSADFDVTVSPSKCLQNVILHAGRGSIVVFHDSEKAFSRLEYSLPRVMDHFLEKGFRFEKI
jgi:peptidoglycan/xylan/chitin deacetylase (PgdA/CDA1 family)